MSIFDEIKRNAKVGTPGPWGLPENKPTFGTWHGCYMPADWDGMGRLSVFSVTAGPDHAAPNARRIALVPDLEQIALAAKELADAVEFWEQEGFTAQAAINMGSALAAFREATS